MCKSACSFVWNVISPLVVAQQGFEEANIQLSTLAPRLGHQILDSGNPAQATTLIWQPRGAHLLIQVLRHIYKITQWRSGGFESSYFASGR